MSMPLTPKKASRRHVHPDPQIRSRRGNVNLSQNLVANHGTKWCEDASTALALLTCLQLQLVEWRWQLRPCCASVLRALNWLRRKVPSSAVQFVGAKWLSHPGAASNGTTRLWAANYKSLLKALDEPEICLSDRPVHSAFLELSIKARNHATQVDSFVSTVAPSSPHQPARPELSAVSASNMSNGAWTSQSASSASLASSNGMRVPPGLRHFEGRFWNLRGQSLFYFSLYPPSKRRLRGVVLYLHGAGDHCRRYIPLYERLCEEGFGVITYDLVNHGASDCDGHKTRGHVRSFRQLVEDTDSYVTFAKDTIFSQTGHTAPPLIIAGTSFGALVGLHVVLSGQHKFYAAFWAGPTVGMEMTTLWKVQAAIIQPLALFLPRMRLVPGVDYDLLWRDPGTLQDFKADTLTTKSDITTRTMQQTLSAMHCLAKEKHIEQADSNFCALSMLFLVGSEDHVADQGVTRKFYDKLANTDKEFKVFDGVFHSVFEDPERDEIFDYLCRWLRARFPELQATEDGELPVFIYEP